MGTGISNTQLLDLLKTTLPNLPKLSFEMTLPYQKWHAVNKWFKKDKVQIESGTSIQRNIVLDPQGNARHVRLYQKSPINVVDTHQQVTAPWCQVETYWSVERREMLRNRAPARYIDLLQSRRKQSILDLATLLEQRAWASPNSSTDDLNPMGLTYWISQLTKTQSDASSSGFVGQTVVYGDGTTTTTKGGIDGSTNAKWCNYADTYTAVNATLISKMRKAFHATNFESPMLARDLREGPASDFRIYCPLDELNALEEYATQSNDNIGRDLDPFHASVSFKRIPLLYAPLLDSDTNNPIYGVNHAQFYPIVQSGDWMREEGPMNDVEQINVFTTFLCGSYNYFCGNVRDSGFCIHVAHTS